MDRVSSIHTNRSVEPTPPRWLSNLKATHYEVLGIDRRASFAQIRTAYRNLAFTWYPDRCKLPYAEEIFKRLNASNEILSSPENRSKYDATLPPMAPIEKEPVVPLANIFLGRSHRPVDTRIELYMTMANASSPRLGATINFVA